MSTTTTKRPIVELVDLKKEYRLGSQTVEALRGVNLRIEEGEYLAIIGPSGSGKSTLMHILGCLDLATSGVYELDGVDVSEMDETGLAHVRNRRVGFVFQQFNLLATLSAWRNVELPLIYAGVGRAERKQRALSSLDRVNLGDRVDHHPNELSGGQQQRVAVARALVNEPSLVLADEPTGNLDSASAADVLGLLGELNASGRTVVLITHDVETAHRAQRVVRIKDGEIQSDEKTTS
ncbi:MAG TPA: ABC transporter ATP-binding protein [Acidimicrobiales bacterium]|nr:ABC transporter ATP-binding protein [Acidimicrobiales bacterium]